ncbi:DNA-directed RNA polymerase subunit alpha [Candidatus Margulisiibacteriota bacterium]
MPHKQAWVKFTPESKTYGVFVAEPLEKGFGVTLGNSLRRVLLTQIPGIAITSLSVTGKRQKMHEFSTIDGVKEDVLDIILNLKGVIFKLNDVDTATIKIDTKGKSKVTAQDIIHDASVEIVNPTHYIATLDSKAVLKLTVTLERGFGYRSVDGNKKEESPLGTVFVDSNFSPVVKVNYSVKPIRVGKQIDFDSLRLEVWTNGSITPEDANTTAVDIVIKKLKMFYDLNNPPKKEEPKPVGGVDAKMQAGLDLNVEDLELSSRSTNCLKKAGIQKVSELVEIPMRELMKIKNFGKKSADEINDKLEQYSLSLKDDYVFEEGEGEE